MNKIHTYQIQVKGLVQGVGFRPFIYQIANRFNLKGFVENNNEGICIQFNSTEKIVNEFCSKIDQDAPIVSKVLKIVYKKVAYEYYDKFKIRQSTNASDKITQICPDICICNNCLHDLQSQKHRINYPFINCTHCGPRYSIIKNLPYDRKMTTMHKFKMCEECEVEYNDSHDRRFHAQPIACNNCGPKYRLITDTITYNSYEKILTEATNLLKQGKILAVKGIGGFHLMCDAFNMEAVKLLRKRKKREQKPFAVLFPNIRELKKFVFLSKKEEKLLTHWARSIVLLHCKNEFNPFISNGLNTIGVMLPYTAFHYQIFNKVENKAAFILTSANISDQPIITKNKDALHKLKNIADAFLVYNRKIQNRVDDSVTMLVNAKKRILRRSRGYVPFPINSHKLSVEGIVAAGGELNNCFAMGRGKEIFLSQHIGDLKNLETFHFYRQTLNKFENLFRIKKKIIVTDLHPDYLSTKWGEETAREKNIPILKVQHHHAHIASCMGENQLDEKVIGICFDGTGLGANNTIWGGEFLIADLHTFERVGHFEPMYLPGGDKANKEPWRMAISLLYQTFGEDIQKLNLPIFRQIKKRKVEMILQMINKKMNTPLTSSVGRIFDAIAAICGICYENKYQAQAPMLLENYVDESISESYHYTFSNNIIYVTSMINQIVEDVTLSLPLQTISAKFHNTIGYASIEAIKEISAKTGIKKVILSGGVFQNKYLLKMLEENIIKNGMQVYSHSSVPSNDGGLALGQILIAAKHLSLNLI